MKELSNNKNNHAITLIALVITIVVLIILAAVAINLSLGNNGIFNRAKTAKEQYQNAEAQEQTEVSKSTNQIDSYIEGYRGFSPISYSTDEQNTGLKWIDGSDIYQKTFTGSSSSYVDATSRRTFQIDIALTNVKSIIDYESQIINNHEHLGLVSGSTTTDGNLAVQHTTSLLFSDNGGVVSNIRLLYQQNYRTCTSVNYVLTLKYTKNAE